MQRKKVEEQPKEEEGLSREQKIQRLKELQARLEQVEQEEVIQPTDELESHVENELAKATAGTELSAAQEKALEVELAKLEEEIQVEEKEVVKQKPAYDQLLEIHEWLEKPAYGFMYSIPKQDKDFVSWKQEWGQVLLDYAKINKEHIVYLNMLLTKRPFNKFNDRKKAVNLIADDLVEKKLAEWMEKGFMNKLMGKRERLRVYWRSLEDWADVILQWARENAILDLVMIMDIRNADQDFASLPDEDLREIFSRIDSLNRGEMVELEDGEFGIKFKLI